MTYTDSPKFSKKKRRRHVLIHACMHGCICILTEALESSESRVARSSISSTRERMPRTWTSRASGECVCWISFSIMLSSDDIVNPPVVAGTISVVGVLPALLPWPVTCWACWDLISDSILLKRVKKKREFWLPCLFCESSL